MIYLVISEKAHEGKTTFCYELARSSNNSLIIDLDFYQSNLLSLHHYGVIDFLQGYCTLDQCIIQCNKFNYLFPSQNKYLDVNIFKNNALANLIKQLNNNYADIIIDTIPYSYVSEVLDLVSLADKIYILQNHQAVKLGGKRPNLTTILQNKDYSVIVNDFKVKNHKTNILYKEVNEIV